MSDGRCLLKSIHFFSISVSHITTRESFGPGDVGWLTLIKPRVHHRIRDRGDWRCTSIVEIVTGAGEFRVDFFFIVVVVVVVAFGFERRAGISQRALISILKRLNGTHIIM